MFYHLSIITLNWKLLYANCVNRIRNNKDTAGTSTKNLGQNCVGKKLAEVYKKELILEYIQSLQSHLIYLLLHGSPKRGTILWEKDRHYYNSPALHLYPICANKKLVSDYQ